MFGIIIVAAVEWLNCVCKWIEALEFDVHYKGKVAIERKNS